MTCSGASRLISLVVDDSDDKTTTFTPLLFNFYLIPQAFLSRTESSQPLSVFRSVHLSPHFPSPLPSSPGAFCLFIPPCHELTTFFLSHCVFYMSRHFSSLFVPPLIPCGPLSLSRRPVKPTPFHLCPFIFVLFYPAAVSVSSSLSLLVPASPSCISDPNFSLFGILHTLLLIPTSPFWSSYFFCSSGRESFCFPCSHFFLLECCGSHAERSLPHLPFKSLTFSVHSAKRHYRALRKVRKREGAELLRSRDRDK